MASGAWALSSVPGGPAGVVGQAARARSSPAVAGSARHTPTVQAGTVLSSRWADVFRETGE